MIKYAVFGTFICLLIAPLTQAQLKQASTGDGNRILLGRLPTVPMLRLSAPA